MRKFGEMGAWNCEFLQKTLMKMRPTSMRILFAGIVVLKKTRLPWENFGEITKKETFVTV